MTSQFSFTVHIEDKNNQILNLAKESAMVYNQSLDLFWSNLNNNQFLFANDIEKLLTVQRTLLHSQSFQGSIQLASKAVQIYFKILKEYKKNPNKFSGCPRQPKEHKSVQMIIFKKSAIRFLNGYLLLSTKNEPLKFRWNINEGLPVYATITWKRETGWQLNLILERENDIHQFVEDKLLAIDLGIKRIAAIYDEERVILYSGKLIMSLNRLRDKINAMTQRKLSVLSKHSRRYKKIKSANRQVARRINNKITDILHKYSRTIVNYCVENEIGTIAVGDCSGIHNSPKCGRVNNQKIVPHPEQRLLKYIRYKFEDIGGVVKTTPEAYTSRTCPCCGLVKQSSPNGRIFRCQGCGFEYDRDGVGAMNIYMKEKVSFGERKRMSELNVVGGLTPPIGLKYISNQDCLIRI